MAKKKVTKNSRILASLQEIMGGADAVKVASSKILAALGESPVSLLRAKAAQYEEMAEMLEACMPDATSEEEAEAEEEVEPDEDDKPKDKKPE